MNYANIKYRDIADGEGVRTTLFVSGCSHHCENCFQPETWSFSYGQEFTTDIADEVLATRVIDMNETRKTGEVVLWKDEEVYSTHSM